VRKDDMLAYLKTAALTLEHDDEIPVRHEVLGGLSHEDKKQFRDLMHEAFNNQPDDPDSLFIADSEASAMDKLQTVIYYLEMGEIGNGAD